MSVVENLKVLPVGREMFACSMAFKEVASSYICRNAVPLIFSQIQTPNQDAEEKNGSDTYHDSSNMDNWRCFAPLLKCFKRLLKYVDANHPTDYSVQTIYSLVLGAIALSQHGDSLEGLIILRCLLGHSFDHGLTLKPADDSLNEGVVLMKTFEEKIHQGYDDLSSSVGKSLLNQVQCSITLLCSILENSGLLEDSVQIVLEGTYLPFGVVRSVLMTSRLMPSLASVNHESVLFFSNAWKIIADSEEPVEGEFSKRLVWELPDSSLERPGQSASRKLALGEAASRRIKDNQAPEPTGQFARGLSTASASAGHARRDTFRHRKPNTSRPPSMHVDDYVARERNIDGASSASNIVNSTPRGTLSGRPPSIHVDEFMARQRERQNPVPAPSGDAPQVKGQTSLDDNVRAKTEKLQQPKADLDDDQEIDIVFDGESESDDKLPFPQPDDNLPPPVIVGENSPGPVVEETENQNEKVPFSIRDMPVSKNSESLGADISSRTAMPPEANVSLERKDSVSSPEKNAFSDQADEPAYISSRNKRPAEAPLRQLRPNNYQKRSPYKLSESSVSSGSHGHDHRLSKNQPPLPPMPLPTSSMPIQSPDSSQRRSSSYSARDGPPPFSSNYTAQPFEASMPTAFVGLQAQTEHALASNGTSSSNAPNADGNFLWNTYPINRLPMEHFNSGSSARQMAPLPPPYSVPASQHAAMSSGSPASLYNQGNSVVQPLPSSSLMNDANSGMNSASGSAILSTLLPSFASQFLMGRPPMPTQFYGTSLQHVQLSSGLPQNVSNPQPSVSSMQARPPPPPPLPQQPHPSQTQQNLGSVQWQQHQEQAQSYAQSSMQPQMALQFQNQIPVPQMQLYQSQQEFAAQALRQVSEQSQLANQSIQAGSSSQQQREADINLQQLFSSPEAIQSLLNDRERLTDLLEHNPKLMQMLQVKLEEVLSKQ